jgi:thioredoxin reductase
MNRCDVAILGAGPYGLSIAAHLKGAGVNFRIFGSPMHTWMTQMPKGMHLKSEGFASFLYDPQASFTLAKYCQERGIPYADQGLPVPIQTFIDYGRAFQQKFVPELEQKLVRSVERTGDGFQLVLDNGERVTARRVVVAVGISHFGYVPPMLAALPETLATHSSRHSSLDSFHGKHVAVVGAGASALDLAALLHEAGASVELVARAATIRFHDPPSKKRRSFIERLRYPRTGIGPGWKLYLCAYKPWAFRYLPESYRLRAVKKILGPAPGWFIKEHVAGKVPFHLDTEITGAREESGQVRLELSHAGASKSLLVDHVIAATGFRVDLGRLQFLSADIQSSLETVEQTPLLSSAFESSVPGLFFVGTSAANTFGPLMRFAYGARFTAQRLSAYLAKTASPIAVPIPAPANSFTAERDEVGVR